MADLHVSVTPRAHRDAIGRYADGTLHVRVTRPPADGEANLAVVRLVADALDVPPSTISIAGGQRSRRKRLRVDALDGAELEWRLRHLAGD